MKKILFGLRASAALSAMVILTACGGGAGDAGETSNDGGNYTSPTYYTACITKEDSPSYNCSPSCSEDEYALGYHSEVEECETAASEFIASFTSSDTPSTEEHQEGLDIINNIRVGVGLPAFKYS